MAGEAGSPASAATATAAEWYRSPRLQVVPCLLQLKQDGYTSSHWQSY